MIDDYDEREKVLRSMKGATRDLYLIENYLLMGDTVSAYLVFRDMADRDLPDGGLYRYAKVVLTIG